jgi:hypothetical protein
MTSGPIKLHDYDIRNTLQTIPALFVNSPLGTVGLKPAAALKRKRTFLLFLICERP